MKRRAKIEAIDLLISGALWLGPESELGRQVLISFTKDGVYMRMSSLSSLVLRLGEDGTGT